MILTVALVSAVAVSSVIAVRSVVGEPDGLVPGATGPLARNVFVAEEFLAEEPFVPYASTIQVVRSGPDGPRVVRTFEALGAPDMALTADGSRLYMLSEDRRPGDELVAFDVATGDVDMTARLQPMRRVVRVSGWPIPCCPTMEVQRHGSGAFAVTPGADEIYVASYPLSLLLLEMETGRVIEVPGVGPRHEMLETAG